MLYRVHLATIEILTHNCSWFEEVLKRKPYWKIQELTMFFYEYIFFSLKVGLNFIVINQ
jgi:hypothetical protein